MKGGVKFIRLFECVNAAPVIKGKFIYREVEVLVRKVCFSTMQELWNWKVSLNILCCLFRTKHCAESKQIKLHRKCCTMPAMRNAIIC